MNLQREDCFIGRHRKGVGWCSEQVMGAGKVGSDRWTGGLHGLTIIEEERDVAGWWGLSLQSPDMNVSNSHVIHEVLFCGCGWVRGVKTFHLKQKQNTHV